MFIHISVGLAAKLTGSFDGISVRKRENYLTDSPVLFFKIRAEPKLVSYQQNTCT